MPLLFTSTLQLVRLTNVPGAVSMAQATLKRSLDATKPRMTVPSVVCVHSTGLGERLRFATCGFLRLLVLRRSPLSGILCRVAEAPVRNAAAAADTQLFRWPSKQELLDEFRHYRETDSKEDLTEYRGSMDRGLRRRAYRLPLF